ncbi:phage portal protein [Variovorax paradoxus]|uniref:phage portal protein n=1 Tax=Variovorax paradoxus TaxID=34073 RepID=UPI003D647F14
MTARSRDLQRNNGLVPGAMQTMRDNIVGSVLRLSATPDYRRSAGPENRRALGRRM